MFKGGIQLKEFQNILEDSNKNLIEDDPCSFWNTVKSKEKDCAKSQEDWFHSVSWHFPQKETVILMDNHNRISFAVQVSLGNVSFIGTYSTENVLITDCL